MTGMPLTSTPAVSLAAALALRADDLEPSPSIDLNGPLVATIAACVLLAVVLVVLVVLLSRPWRTRTRNGPHGMHSATGDKAVWRDRIADVVARHGSGVLGRDEAFAELAAIARDFASSRTGRDLASHTLADISAEPRTARVGLDLLRMTIAALYPPEFADAALDAHARAVTVEEAAGWVSNLVERWGR